MISNLFLQLRDNKYDKMFFNCSKVQSLDLSNFKTERVLNMTETNFNDKMKIFEEKRNDLRTIYLKQFHQIRRYKVKSQDYSNKNVIPYEKKYISDIIGQLINNYSLNK